MGDYELSDIEVKTIDNWIMENIVPQKGGKKTHASFALKTLFEESSVGFFITNKQFKEAMVRCNFTPVNKNKLNWDFRVSLKSET
nr:hypothetical protein [uncultured Methanolobus sp.]